MEQKVYNMLGLAKRAGKLQIGTYLTTKEINYGNPFLVVIASDASDNTKKKIITHCKYDGAKYFEFGDKASLGACIGKNESVCMAIMDENFANGIIKILKEYNFEVIE